MKRKPMNRLKRKSINRPLYTVNVQSDTVLSLGRLAGVTIYNRSGKDLEFSVKEIRNRSENAEKAAA